MRGGLIPFKESSIRISLFQPLFRTSKMERNVLFSGDVQAVLQLRERLHLRVLPGILVHQVCRENRKYVSDGYSNLHRPKNGEKE